MGCQMNVSDSEIVNSILMKAGMSQTSDMKEADVLLVNTCSVRDNAERKVWERLNFYNSIRKKREQFHATKRTGKILDSRAENGLPGDRSKTPTGTTIGILGCMAERLKTKLLEAEKGVDLVVGPDAYRDLPNLLTQVLRSSANEEEEEDHTNSNKAVNVVLSVDETYADISPVRNAGVDSLKAFVSIMRGCNNMCSYCIVPFTRGRERSREAQTIVDEVRRLRDSGCKEVTLLGQNVNSYNYLKGERIEGVDFTALVDAVSMVDPELRVRFTSPHPKDFPDDLVHLIGERHNVCSYVHLPAQSGSSEVLDRMRRGYTREAYLRLVEKMRNAIPDLTLSTDIIVGFCGETEQQHEDTLSLMREVVYDQAFMFKYSTRERTHAHRNYEDDVPEKVKSRRLSEVISTFYDESEKKNLSEIGKLHLVLVEGPSKKNQAELVGRSCNNKKIIFPSKALRDNQASSSSSRAHPSRGDYVLTRVTSSSAQSLRGELLDFSTMASFYGLAQPTTEGYSPFLKGEMRS
eukprot:jgi/Bigna1/58069/fgenesh1_pm.51_\